MSFTITDILHHMPPPTLILIRCYHHCILDFDMSPIPIPCQLYTEMCDTSYKCFVRLDMIWCWPILACLSLMLSYLFHLKHTGIILISCSCEKLRKKSSNNKNPTENQNISLTLQQKKKKVEVVTTKSVEIKNGCTNV